LKTMIFCDVTTVLNERKHLKIAFRSVPDSVSLVLDQMDRPGLTGNSIRIEFPTTRFKSSLHGRQGTSQVTTGRMGCWSKGNATASAGAAGPYYAGTTGRRKQRVAAAELSVPQDLSKDHGPTGSSGRRRRLRRGRSTTPGTTGRDGSAGRLCRSTPQQADDMITRPSGSGKTSQSDARDFGPKLLHADRPTGRGPGGQITSD
jgi:hypothetical protein